jgi:phosphoglucomutase
VPAHRAGFGTSAHRGSSFDVSFNEWHVLASGHAFTPTPPISRAIVKPNRCAQGTPADGIVVTPAGPGRPTRTA